MYRDEQMAEYVLVWRSRTNGRTQMIPQCTRPIKVWKMLKTMFFLQRPDRSGNIGHAPNKSSRKTQNVCIVYARNWGSTTQIALRATYLAGVLVDSNTVVFPSLSEAFSSSEMHFTFKIR